MFSQATITNVYPPVYAFGSLLIKWASSSALGTVFQVYLNRVLAWSGTATQVSLPWPQSAVSVDIGTVLASEQFTDFSSSLAAAPNNIVDLAWLGGTFLASDISGFYVYGSDAANNPVDYTKPLATIPAYPGGIVLDGFGMGGWNQGGFGHAASQYGWSSQPLYTGVWSYAVDVYDKAGNTSSFQTASIFLGVPPRESPPFTTDYKRLHYTLNAPIGLGWNENGYNNQGWPAITVTLEWLPTPG